MTEQERADDLTTLEREVLEAAELVRHVFAGKSWELSDPAGRDVVARATALADMLNAAEALRATRQPKAVRPEEVEPGTRFCFPDDERDEIPAVIMTDAGRMGRPRVWHREGRHDIFQFRSDARIIPIPEQD